MPERPLEQDQKMDLYGITLDHIIDWIEANLTVDQVFTHDTIKEFVKSLHPVEKGE